MYLPLFNHRSQELTGKRVGQRRFVWFTRDNFPMFIYFLMHAFGVIVFFIWFLYAANGTAPGQDAFTGRILIQTG
jgi:hypothetical protein